MTPSNTPRIAGIAQRLHEEVIVPLKARYVAREEVIDLIALALTAGEHLFLYGPPGTAKSALIRAFARRVHGRYFEYLLTRFAEPNELFGPIDLVKLREGVVATVTTGMLPESEFIFLDELFNANSAILNNLLTVLNERVYRRGAEIHRLPLLAVYAASNHLPEDEALGALFDRFLLRCRVEQLPRENLPSLLTAGWDLERGTGPTDDPATITAEELRLLARASFEVDLSAVRELLSSTIGHIRDLGIGMTDRRAVKSMKLIAASAVLCGRASAVPADLWVLRYVWDRVEQIGPLSGLIQELLQRHVSSGPVHELSALPERPNPEAMAREVQQLEAEATGKALSLAAISRLRESAGRLSDRIAWLPEGPAKAHLADRIATLLQRLRA